LGRKKLAEIERPNFDSIWQTLVRTGIAGQLDGRTTITPSAYKAHPDVDVTLPPPVGTALHPDLEALPEISVGDGAKAAVELQLGEELGKGGMGSVLRARQASLQREVAVKRLHKVEDGNVEALLREARIVGDLQHPNIVPVHMLGRSADGFPVLVMKAIDGERWTDILRRDRKSEDGMVGATLDRHLAILKDVCNAVHYAHSRGVVHRDLKPENVLVGDFGEVVLVDWGVAARLGEPGTGMALGTPAYMAPEMVHGDAPSVATDVYLLGATLHQVMTGRGRHKAKTMQETLLQAYTSVAYDYADEIPGELATIANKATEAEMAMRYPTALAFREALDAFEFHRTSRQLAQVAGVRLEELTELLAAKEVDVRRVAEVGSACRFGLRQALDEWSGNPFARGRLRLCLEKLVAFQIEHGDATEAASMLAELLKLAGSGGKKRYRQLSHDVDVAVRRQAALHRLGEELDMSVNSGWRVTFLAWFALSAAVVGGSLVGAIRIGVLTHTHTLGIGVSLFAAVFISGQILLFRRWLLRNVASQRVMYTLMVITWSLALFRVLAWRIDMDLHHVVVTDILLIATGSGVASVGISQGLWILTGALILCAIAAAMLPAFSFEIATLAVVMAGGVMAAVFAHWIGR